MFSKCWRMATFDSLYVVAFKQFDGVLTGFNGKQLWA